MSHQALLFSAPASPFELGSRPTPKPGSGEVLVKNVAVALNPIDYLVQHLGVWVDYYGFPACLGFDGAGEIEAIGEDVQGWKKGDRVLYEALFSPDKAAFQEYVITDAVQLAKIPANLSFEEAATFPLGFATAAIGLYYEYKAVGGIGLEAPWDESGYKKYAGQPALVTGGASSVGQYAIQLLKASGFDPIITTASKHNEAYCKSAGATHVIDYYEVPYAELPAAVKKLVSAPIPVVYDAVGYPETQKASWETLAPNGKLLTVRHSSVGKPGEVGEDGKQVAWVFGSANVPFQAEFGKKMFAGLTKLLESGDVKPNNFEVIPRGLAGIPDALVRLAKGVSGVKLVARVAETSGEVGGEGLSEAIPQGVHMLRKVYPVGTLPNF
ncbi:GroES-like protein [Cytidiella melzeri]|nr:GroES-like protein [Cytidiella melzeri]